MHQATRPHLDATGNTASVRVLLDDVDDALARMTQFGRAVAEPLSLSIRAAVRARASSLGWLIADHHEYVSWTRQCTTDENTWIVADPLYPLEQLGARGRLIRVTRSVNEHGQLAIDPRTWEVVGDDRITNEVGILDDAASSGSTIAALGRFVLDSGAHITRIVLCASSAPALRSLSRAFPRSEVTRFLDQDAQVLHLRDACPGLPFSGRGNPDHAAVLAPAGKVVIRTFAPLAGGRLWSELLADETTCRCILDAPRVFAAELSNKLGRPALVADMAPMSSSATVAIQPGKRADSASLLASVIEPQVTR